jgi:hypothetical protein
VRGSITDASGHKQPIYALFREEAGLRPVVWPLHLPLGLTPAPQNANGIQGRQPPLGFTRRRRQRRQRPTSTSTSDLHFDSTSNTHTVHTDRLLLTAWLAREKYLVTSPRHRTKNFRHRGNRHRAPRIPISPFAKCSPLHTVPIHWAGLACLRASHNTCCLRHKK